MRTISLISVLLLAGCNEQDLPVNQANFISVNKAAVKRYAEAENNLKHPDIIKRRNSALCSGLPTGAVEKWVGTVQRISVNLLDSATTASVDIRISETKSYFLFKTSAINLKTLSGALADAAAAVAIGKNPKTAIAENTPLYRQLTALKAGDKVAFSGHLLKDPKGCFYELSMSTNGKIRWPEYALRLVDISKIN